MSKNFCPVCRIELSVEFYSWHLLCKRCGYEKANLQTTINLVSAHNLIDEDARETGLRELRIGNFKKLMSIIKSIRPNGGRLLDVGCAYGWFLEVAKKDFDVFGLEPDKNIFEIISRRGLPVRMGYFPGALNKSEKFDVIVFNDVIEHIPNIELILAFCHQRLNQNGLLVINVPNSRGIFYKISKLFCQLGFSGFFERLWQKDLPSPHLHYFNLFNLVSLLKNNGFDMKTSGSLSTIRINGLYKRISYAGNLSSVLNIIIYIGVMLFFPILTIMPKDIIYVVSMRK